MNSTTSIVVDNEKIWKTIHRKIKVVNQYNQDFIAKTIAIERII